jgi:hypothetical protein
MLLQRVKYLALTLIIETVLMNKTRFTNALLEEMDSTRRSRRLTSSSYRHVAVDAVRWDFPSGNLALRLLADG